jgi:hypothetical protein
MDPAYDFSASHTILSSTLHDIASVSGVVMQSLLTFLKPRSVHGV